MNKSFSNFVDGIFILLLVVCPLHCIVSSFGLAVNIPILSLFTALFVFVFGLFTATKEKKSEYALSMGIMAVIFVITVALFSGVLLAELDYAVNTIAYKYSSYINGIGTVDFSSDTATDATALFVAVSAVLSGFLTVFIMRMRFLFPAVTLSVISVVPCFILVNTLPELLPLLVLFATLFTLFISAQLHRVNAVHSGAISLVVAVLVAVLVAGVLHFVPQESYKRDDWQNKLLTFIEEVTGLKDKAEDDKIIDSVEKEIDLSAQGPQKLKGKKVMTVTTPHTGTLYLKGVAYANYGNNTWSILDESVAQSFPQGYNSFVMTDNQNGRDIMLDISTNNKESILYTPYYLDGLNVYGNRWCDVFIENALQTTDYMVYYSPFNVDDPLNGVDEEMLAVYGRRPDIDNCSIIDNSDNAMYKSFVYKNYLALPDNVKQDMQALIKKEGLANIQQSEKVYAVQNYIRNSAVYSLKTKKVPKDKDIALWFLKESETGYCVHFATSATVMLRAMGIPARYVTGYVKTVRAGAVTPVTTDNAHAWVEYFDEEKGWVPLEVTPSDFNPGGNDIESSTEELATTATEPPTKATQPEATEPPASTENATEASSEEAEEALAINPSAVFAVTGVLLLLAVVALLVRRLILLMVLKHSLAKGTHNNRARCAYRYLLKLEKHAQLPVSSEVVAIANKARFGEGEISDKELEAVLQFVKIRKALLKETESKTKKLYYKFILALA
ncbi:MAG: transglutaminase domain-containing protein [Acutalibacteraceae bacterium]|nr:transglutaminase domain-containing protein [Acutalibacteraceae bacterium]